MTTDSETNLPLFQEKKSTILPFFQDKNSAILPLFQDRQPCYKDNPSLQFHRNLLRFAFVMHPVESRHYIYVFPRTVGIRQKISGIAGNRHQCIHSRQIDRFSGIETINGIIDMLLHFVFGRFRFPTQHQSIVGTHRFQRRYRIGTLVIYICTVSYTHLTLPTILRV